MKRRGYAKWLKEVIVSTVLSSIPDTTRAGSATILVINEEGGNAILKVRHEDDAPRYFRISIKETWV